MKSCQIHHNYGDEQDDYNEDEALHLTTSALKEGQVPPTPSLTYVEMPEGALVDIGGKSCKWCGSTTHTRKNHRDCPHNKNKTVNKTVNKE